MAANRGMDADAVHPAIVQVQTEQQLLHQRLESSITAMTGHMAALQADMGSVKTELRQLTNAQAEFSHHSSGLERLGAALEKFIESTERRWAAHEAENRLVAATVDGHKGGLRTGLFFVALLIAAVGTINALQIKQGEQRMVDHLRSVEAAEAAKQQRFSRNEQDLRDLRADMKALKTP